VWTLRSNRKLQFRDHVGRDDDRSHSAVSQTDVFDPLHRRDGFKQALHGGNVRCEARSMLVEEQVFGNEEREVGAFGGLDPHDGENVIERNALAIPQCDRAELAAPAAAAGDLHSTESGAVPEWRDALQPRTVPFRLAR
jgi:hypothetical protein